MLNRNNLNHKLRIYSKYILVCKRKALLLYKRYLEQNDAVGIKYCVYDRDNKPIHTMAHVFRHNHPMSLENVGKYTVQHHLFDIIQWVTLAIFTEMKQKMWCRQTYKDVCEYFKGKQNEYQDDVLLSYLDVPDVKIRWAIDAFRMAPDDEHEDNLVCLHLSVPLKLAVSQSYANNIRIAV